MSAPATIAPAALTSLFEEARSIYGQMLETEHNIRRDYDLLFLHAWLLGQKLHTLKDSIGHGRWLFWLGANWPGLGEKKAQLCMQFHRANESVELPNPTNLADLSALFTVDSIRALLGGYIPAKLRPQLEGDARLSPPAHHFGFVSAVTKWDRQLDIRLIPEPEVELMRAEVAPAIRILAKRLGPDWLRHLLDTPETS